MHGIPAHADPQLFLAFIRRAHVGRYLMVSTQPGPDPVALINKAVLASIKLELSPAGMKAFNLIFPAALGTMLSETLKYALSTQTLEPKVAKIRAIHNHIYRSLVLILAQHPTVLVEAHAACGELGPACVQWLNDRYNPTTTTSRIVSLMSIIRDPVDHDNLLGSIRATVASNAQLVDELKLAEPVVVVIILLNLSESYNFLRQIVIEKDRLSTVNELQSKLINITSFAAAPAYSECKVTGRTSFVAVKDSSYGRNANTKLFCFNCELKQQP